MSLNLSGQDSSATSNVNEQPSYAAAEHTRHMHSGANWFFWIAGLSLINSVIALVKGGWSFLAGLGVTQVIDGLAIGLSDELGAQPSPSHSSSTSSSRASSSGSVCTRGARCSGRSCSA